MMKPLGKHPNIGASPNNALNTATKFNVTVIPLNVPVALFIAAGIQQVQLPQRFSMPGDSIVFDASYANTAGIVEIIFEQDMGAGNQWITLQPGIVYSFLTVQFTAFFLRITLKEDTTNYSPTFFGNLLVGKDIRANLVGSSPGNASFTRDLPGRTTFVTRGMTPTGNPGVVAQKMTSSISSGVEKVRYTVTNIGLETVWLGPDDSAGAPSETSLYVLPAGETRTFTRSCVFNTPKDLTRGKQTDAVLFIYSDKSTAICAWIQEEFGG